MFELSGNFKEYLYGKLRSAFTEVSQENRVHPDLAECTFKPAILTNSIKLDAK